MNECPSSGLDNQLLPRGLSQLSGANCSLQIGAVCYAACNATGYFGPGAAFVCTENAYGDGFANWKWVGDGSDFAEACQPGTLVATCQPGMLGVQAVPFLGDSV